MIVMEAALSRQLSALSRIKKLQRRADLTDGSQLRAESCLYRPKYFALRSVYSFHFSGRSSRAKMAETGHTGTQAPQSMHSTGSIYNISSVPYLSESFLG